MKLNQLHSIKTKNKMRKSKLGINEGRHIYEIIEVSTGKIIASTINLRQYCRDNNLLQNNMSSIANGNPKRRTHKGLTVNKVKTYISVGK